MTTELSLVPASDTAAALCEARGISQDFTLPNGKPLRVLDGISLEIRPREIVALLGPSGCGKSTILRILAGLIRPTLGEVRYRGDKLEDLNPGVAIVFQSFALYPWMTVAENVQAVLKARSFTPAEVRDRASQAIRTVGLAGFEDSYPRELSGGMKQRVGMARALSVSPELLFMDEPFSQVDALTAESLRAEVVDIWSSHNQNPSSVLMVSHDIKEVVYMADRIVVLSANPGRIRTIMENKLPRPRDYRSPEFLRLVDRLHEIITGAEMPDLPAPEHEPATPIAEPLPEALPSAIVGLLEYLDARTGTEDVFRIAADTSQEFGGVIRIVKAAEMLDFVDTPKRLVILSSEGQRFVRASAEDRKTVWRERLLQLRLFQDLKHLLERSPDHRIDRDLVLETIIFQMPQENYETMFDSLVAWARYGELASYDEATETLYIPDEEAAE
jgi:NitT/TauT family transport system ATP-binding protein